MRTRRACHFQLFVATAIALVYVRDTAPVCAKGRAPKRQKSRLPDTYKHEHSVADAITLLPLAHGAFRSEPSSDLKESVDTGKNVCRRHPNDCSGVQIYLSSPLVGWLNAELSTPLNNHRAAPSGGCTMRCLASATTLGHAEEIHRPTPSCLLSRASVDDFCVQDRVGTQAPGMKKSTLVPKSVFTSRQSLTEKDAGKLLACQDTRETLVHDASIDKHHGCPQRFPPQEMHASSSKRRS